MTNGFKYHVFFFMTLLMTLMTTTTLLTTSNNIINNINNIKQLCHKPDDLLVDSNWSHLRPSYTNKFVVEPIVSLEPIGIRILYDLWQTNKQTNTFLY